MIALVFSTSTQIPQLKKTHKNFGTVALGLIPIVQMLWL